MVDQTFVETLLPSECVGTHPFAEPLHIRKESTPKIKTKPPARTTKTFQHTIELLQRFVQQHFVFVFSRSYPEATTTPARIVSFGFRSTLSVSESAISIQVCPPPEIQQLFDADPPLWYMHNVPTSARTHMDLSTYMHILLAQQHHTQHTELYEDVGCRIDWNQSIKDPTILMLSQWIPTRVLLAQFQERSQNREYNTYLDAARQNAILIAVFMSDRFRKLFSIEPAAFVPSHVMIEELEETRFVSFPPIKTTDEKVANMEIEPLAEVSDDHETKEVNRNVVPQLTWAKPIEAPFKKKRSREVSVLPCSSIRLRPRCLRSKCRRLN